MMRAANTNESTIFFIFAVLVFMVIYGIGIGYYFHIFLFFGLRICL